jgi:hypothetical protein
MRDREKERERERERERVKKGGIKRERLVVWLQWLFSIKKKLNHSSLSGDEAPSFSN